MKKFLFLTIFAVVLSFASPAISFAQEVSGKVASENNAIEQHDDGHTAREEAKGREIWEKLQSGELECKDLSDDDFGALGEHFMGQMMGSSHEAMNTMMMQMMGEEGEEQMHIVMGNRMSGCDPNAPVTQNMMDSGLMPMMNMMMGGGMMGSGMMGEGGNSMPVLSGVEGMGNFGTNPMGWFGWNTGWVFMILFWGLVILVIVALIKWIMNQGKHEAKSKTALDILKERYAKGEIDKKEFQERRKNLS